MLETVSVDLLAYCHKKGRCNRYQCATEIGLAFIAPCSIMISGFFDNTSRYKIQGSV